MSLSDASVRFNVDVHALFFSKDAVGIETAMYERLADLCVNTVNRRRCVFRPSRSPIPVEADQRSRRSEATLGTACLADFVFFRATPLEVKEHLSELAGELLQFLDEPEALEYRQCLAASLAASSVGSGAGMTGLTPQTASGATGAGRALPDSEGH